MTKIMIIDDQPLLAKWLTNDLVDEEYHISWMVNADNIKEDIRKFMPDIVLLDICLNGFERWDILERIKIKYPHLPVLIEKMQWHSIGRWEALVGRTGRDGSEGGRKSYTGSRHPFAG